MSKLALILCFGLVFTAGEARQQPVDSMVELYFSQFRYREAALYLQKTIGNKTKLTGPREVYLATKLAQLSSKKGDNIAALRWAKLASDQLSGIADSVLIAEVNLTTAHALIGLGKMDEAVKSLRAVSDYCKRHNVPKILHKCLQEYGNLAMINGQYSQAEVYFKECVHLERINRLDAEITQDLINLGLLFCSTNRLDSADIYLTRTMELAKNQKDTIMLSLSHAVRSYFFLLQNDRFRWKDEIMHSISLAKVIDHKMLISNGYTQLMQFALSEKKYKEAIHFGNQAKELIKSGDIPLFEANVDSLLYEAYKYNNQPILALRSFESYYRAKNKILTQSQFEALQSLKAEHAINEKNLVIALQTKNLENAYRKQQLLWLAVIFLTAVLLFILTIYWLKRRQTLFLFRKEKLMESMMEGRLFRKSVQPPSLISTLVIPEEHTESSPEDNSLEELSENHKELFEEMMRLIEEQKLYLNPQLDQKLLVTLLRTNKSYLYRAISQHGMDHFKNIVNHFRVREAKSLLEAQCTDGKKELPEEIYSQAGFNSVTSFYRAFKHFTGLTPKEYMQEYIKDLRKAKTEKHP